MSLAVENRGQISFSLKWTTWIQVMRNTHHFLSCHWDLISWPFLSEIWFHSLMLWWKGTKKRALIYFWLWHWKIEVNSLSVWNEQLEFKSERHPPFPQWSCYHWDLISWPFLSDIWFHALMLWWKGTKKRAWFFWLWHWKIEVNSLSVWNEQLEFKSERHPPFPQLSLGPDFMSLLSEIWFHALMLWWKGTKKRAWFFWLWQWKIEVNSLSVWNEQLEFKSERHPPFPQLSLGPDFMSLLSEIWFHALMLWWKRN